MRPLLLKSRLRFSIRAMLVAMTLLAIFFWYHLNWIQQRHQAINSRQLLWEPHADRLVRAPGLLPLFGESGFANLTGVYRDPLEWVREQDRFERLFPEAKIDAIQLHGENHSFPAAANAPRSKVAP